MRQEQLLYLCNLEVEDLMKNRERVENHRSKFEDWIIIVDNRALFPGSQQSSQISIQYTQGAEWKVREIFWQFIKMGMPVLPCGSVNIKEDECQNIILEYCLVIQVFKGAMVHPDQWLTMEEERKKPKPFQRWRLIDQRE
jgi:hypothetical protein